MSTDTMVSTREVPWMKLGKLAEAPMTAREAATLGGIDFQVEKRALAFETDTGVGVEDAIEWTQIDERCAIVRQDTNEWLGIMSSAYPILQYSEAFDFMDTVGSTYVAAGSLRGGKQAFMVLQAPDMPQLKLVNGSDPHDLFVVLRTSHDGSRAVEVMVMPLRGRCMNQLTLGSFSREVKDRWSIKHTTTMSEKLKEAQVTLANLQAYAARLDENATRLADIKLTTEKATQTIRYVLRDRPKKDEVVETILGLWQNADVVGYHGTGWGLVNAVSEYFEWHRALGTPESRFVGALQGQTHTAINKTATLLLTRS